MADEQQLFQIYGSDGIGYAEFSRFGGYRLFDVVDPLVDVELLWVPIAVYSIVQEMCAKSFK